MLDLSLKPSNVQNVRWKLNKSIRHPFFKTSIKHLFFSNHLVYPFFPSIPFILQFQFSSRNPVSQNQPSRGLARLGNTTVTRAGSSQDSEVTKCSRGASLLLTVRASPKHVRRQVIRAQTHSEGNISVHDRVITKVDICHKGISFPKATLRVPRVV